MFETTPLFRLWLLEHEDYTMWTEMSIFEISCCPAAPTSTVRMSKDSDAGDL